MKKMILIGGLVVLVLALAAAGKLFTTPLEASVKKQVKVLDYQQQGNFDFTITAKPSYYYDGVPVEAAEPSPQIPLNYIDTFALEYVLDSKSTATDSLGLQAILESPGVWKKTITLAPPRSGLAGTSVLINVPYYMQLADTIEKEIGVSAPSHDLTIRATASNGSDPDFVQSLHIKITKAFIKIDDILNAEENGRKGRFDYKVFLRENSLFGATILTPPAEPAVRTGRVLQPGEAVFTEAVDMMRVNFGYSLTSPGDAGQVSEQMTLEAVLENGEVWSKRLTLIPQEQHSGTFIVTFPLDLQYFKNIFETIERETGVASGSRSLTLQASVKATALGQAGIINQTFTQSIKTNLKSPVLTWDQDLQKTEPGALEAPRIVIEPVTLFRLPVLWWRMISLGLALISLCVVASCAAPYLRRGQREPALEAEARAFSRKYRDLIVEIQDWPVLKPGQTSLPLDNLNDLVKVAQGLLKPVHHKAEGDKHIYWVYDDSTRYEYVLVGGMPEKGLKTKVTERLAEEINKEANA